MLLSAAHTGQIVFWGSMPPDPSDFKVWNFRGEATPVCSTDAEAMKTPRGVLGNAPLWKFGLRFCVWSRLLSRNPPTHKPLSLAYELGHPTPP
jgi:hypothetical protein